MTASLAARLLGPALALLPSSCNYVADRGLDFVDQYRAVGGVGSVAGLRYRSLGLLDTGLMFGIKPHASALGWKYGTPFYFNQRDMRFDADQAQIIMATSLIDADYGAGSYFSGRTSAAVLPALLTWTDSTPDDIGWEVPEEGDLFEDRIWLWRGDTFANNRYAQIHAFDIEAEIGFFLYLDLGWSPGELLDFFLGILTIDIAKDDYRL